MFMMTESLRNSLNIISKWGKAAGILIIITGAFTALFGLPLFLIGAAPGVLMIVSGVYLLKSASSASLMSKEISEEPHESLLENYAVFIKWQVFYLGASVVLTLLFIIFFIILFCIGAVAGYNEIQYNF